MRTIYLDYNATTPLDHGVLEAMMPFLTDTWGNPSSVHSLGRRARAALDDARDQTAQVLHCKPSEIVFTSGGTESVNLAVLGAARALKTKGRHIVTSSVEHPAVLSACEYLAAHEGFEITRLLVDREGRVSPEDLQRSLRPDTVLVSIMAANNEIGTIQPVAELGALCRSNGVYFHTDATQWFGKLPVPSVEVFNADAVSLCAHKFHGPKGVGALYIRSPLSLHATQHGGAHENERRAGTENLAGIIGLTAALERFVATPVFNEATLRPLSEALLVHGETIAGAQFVGSRNHRLPNTVAFVAADTDSAATLAGLDLEGICASGGSACTSGALEPSHVATALGLEMDLAKSFIRFSLGRESTGEDVRLAVAIFQQVVARVQQGQQHARPV